MSQEGKKSSRLSNSIRLRAQVLATLQVTDHKHQIWPLIFHMKCKVWILNSIKASLKRYSPVRKSICRPSCYPNQNSRSKLATRPCATAAFLLETYTPSPRHVNESWAIRMSQLKCWEYSWFPKPLWSPQSCVESWIPLPPRNITRDLPTAFCRQVEASPAEYHALILAAYNKPQASAPVVCTIRPS